MMKKLLSILLILVICIGLVPNTASAAVKINKEKITICIGDKYTLKVTGTQKYVMWKSSNRKIAKVSSKGVVTGVGKGSTTITATVGAGGNNKKYTCKVTVKPRLSASNTDITCMLDEYEEITINFKKPKEGEYLVCNQKGDGIVKAEWDENSEDYIIRIIPKEVGITKISIYTATGEDFQDFKINYNEELGINITVISDSKWISRGDLSKLGVSALYYGGCESIPFLRNDESKSDKYLDSYVINDVLYPLEENKIYTGNGIEYKIIDDIIYFNFQNLKELNII